MKKINNLFIGTLIVVATGVYYVTELYKNATDRILRKAAGESEHEKLKRR